MPKSVSLPVPVNEQERLESILNYDVLDTARDEELDQLTHLTANIFKVPIAVITIIDEKRQWFKSNFGLGIKETARSLSFCQYTIMSDEIFEVENALKDERFADNVLVTSDPNIRFYCGAPLINEKGFGMGSLAIVDKVPRKLTDDEKNVLKLLAQQVINHFELHLKKKELEEEKQTLEQKIRERTQELQQKLAELKKRDEKVYSLNNELNRFIYKASHDLLGPLKTMQGLTNLALKETREENILEYLELLYKTEQKLDNTLANLLKVIVIKDVSDIMEVHWHTLIRDAYENALIRNSDKKCELQIHSSVRRPVRTDPLLLGMALEELILNSIQFNHSEHPAIFVSVEEVNKSVAIRLSDNGIGIRDEEKTMIFEMFFKSIHSTGSGLGLYIAKKAIEKLGGEIRLESTRTSGSTFEIILPAYK